MRMIALVLVLTATAVLAVPVSDQDAPSHDELWREVTDGCGQSKACFQYPEDCFVSKNCVAAVSILVVGKTYTFEIQSAGGVYVAVALSADDKMGDDSVVECVSDNAAAEGKLSLYASFNNGHNNAREVEATGLTLDNEASSYDVDSKIAKCKFTRDEVTTFQGVLFDLDKTQYHLLVAVGTKATDSGIGYHDVARSYSVDKRFVADIGYYHQPETTLAE